jgi:hypothetical protein
LITLLHATRRAAPIRVRIPSSVDHLSDFLARDVERRHETQRVRLRRVE